MRRSMLAMFLILVTCGGSDFPAAAQTKPSDATAPVVGPRVGPFEPAVRYDVALTFADFATPWRPEEVIPVLAYLAASPEARAHPEFHVPPVARGRGTVVPISSDGQAFVGDASLRDGVMRVQIAAEQPQRQELAAAAKRVEAALSGPKPVKEQIEQRLREIDEQLSNLKDKMDLLLTLSRSTATIGPEILQERIKAVELEKQRLEMDLAAMEARSQAIAKQIGRVEHQIHENFRDDDILKQLREIVVLREQGAERMRELIEQKVASRSDLAGAEEKIAQAKIRVAEREEALRQTTKSSLLDRLNDELATMMINRAEMDVRLAMLRDLQPPIDMKELDEQKLERLMEQYRHLFRDAGSLPPLYYQLAKQAAELRREKLALLVSEVKVTEAPTTAPVQ